MVFLLGLFGLLAVYLDVQRLVVFQADVDIRCLGVRQIGLNFVMILQIPHVERKRIAGIVIETVKLACPGTVRSSD